MALALDDAEPASLVFSVRSRQVHVSFRKNYVKRARGGLYFRSR